MSSVEDTKTAGAELVVDAPSGVAVPTVRATRSAHSQDLDSSGADRSRPPQKPDSSPPTSRLSGVRARHVSAVPTGPNSRRLHAGHFAFMRAVVQGVDEAAAWDRYLRIEGESSDARAVRSTIAWIRDEFAAAAQRHARYGVARLVRLDSARLAAGGQVRVPALDDFALERGLEDFSQAEQLEALEVEYREVLRRARRRERLIQRQLEALGWLESLAGQWPRARGAVAQPPRASDAVDLWINPLLAGHLQRAGLATLGQLVERINGIGLRWHVPIRGLGPVKAERILTWLRDHGPSIAASGGAPLGAHIDRPRSQVSRAELAAVLTPATDIRPLEKLIVPAALDGSRGLHRRPQSECLLDACDDQQAVLAWLKSKAAASPDRSRRLGTGAGQGGADGPAALEALGKLSHTQRSYRKEAERLLLWAVVERQKALSSLSVEDCAAYRDFIGAPQPRERWCAARSRERWSPLWRPFEGPLGPGAQRQAVRILGNLFNFLAQQNYLAGNPWAGIGLPKNQTPRVDVGRSFTAAQWRFVRRRLASLPDSDMNRRLRLALELLYATGVRLSEAVAATVDDLRWVEYVAHPDDRRGAAGWLLRVVGKGAKVREVPVPGAIVEQLGRALVARGLDADPLCSSNRGVFLLGAVEEGRAVRSGRARAATDEAPTAPQGLRAPSRNGGRDAARAEGKGGLAPNTLAAHLKRFFVDCAEALAAAGDARGSERLRSASTHWLRHTHAAHALAAGVPIDVAQQNLGHASLATTTVYVTSESKRRLTAMGEFWAQTD
jgi:site-specific recombinase XerD